MRCARCKAELDPAELTVTAGPDDRCRALCLACGGREVGAAVGEVIGQKLGAFAGALPALFTGDPGPAAAAAARALKRELSRRAKR